MNDQSWNGETNVIVNRRTAVFVIVIGRGNFHVLIILKTSKMTTKSLCASRSDLIVALPLGPSLSNHFLSYAATRFL
jgi:hypothetical protein